MKEFQKYQEKEGYKLPEKYFDQFAQRMQKEIEEVQPADTWYEKLQQLISFKLAATAISILVLSLLAYSQFQNTNIELSDEEIQAYLIDAEDWDPSEELLAQSAESSTTDEFTDDELLEYLQSDLSESEILIDYTY